MDADRQARAELGRWTVVDRVVAWASPRAGMRRRAARLAEHLHTRRYEAATRGRRSSGWRASGSSANEEVFASLTTLRNRHRQLVRDNEWAGRAVAIWEEEIGALAWNPQTQDAEDLAPLWKEFTEGALDSEGVETFESLQNLLMRSAVEGGDALLRRRVRRMTSRGPERDLPVPLQLEPLEGDFLDHEKELRRERNRPIAQGVEFDATGRRLAYWLHRAHPGSDTFNLADGPRRVRAEDVHHVFRRERIGQIRGIPWGAAAMLTLRDLDDYADAALLRAKLAACYVAFLEDAEAGMSPEAASAWTAEEDPPDTLKPGAFEILPTGRRITFAEPPSPAGLEEMTSFSLHQVATGYGVPHSRLATDYRQVNFTSGRLEEISFSKSVRKARARLARPLCRRVWAWFVEAAILAGRAPRKPLSEFRATWDPPRRELTDPSRMAPALTRLVRLGHNSLSELIRETGRNPEEVFEEIRKERETLRDMGVVLPELGLTGDDDDAEGGE